MLESHKIGTASLKVFELAFYLRIFFNVQHPANIDEWESIWAVNMRGTVLCYKYAAIQMVKQNYGGRLIGNFQSLILCIANLTKQI